jgi:predicted dehydrogenase
MTGWIRIFFKLNIYLKKKEMGLTNSQQKHVSRRKFIKNTGKITLATTLTPKLFPNVHAAENNTVNIALVGCGGRGSGAAANAMKVKNGPIKMVAMADVFEERLKLSHKSLKRIFPDQVDVPEDQKFLGYEGYKHAMDCLKPGDVVILATPPAFRWVHFKYAIDKGLNVFMEKPVTIDGPTTVRMLELGEESLKKNLKVGVGLMCRHCDADGVNEFLYQTQRFHSFLWAGGGAFSDFYIHHIDECCWMKDAWPVKAQAVGGRHYRGNSVDQNFDTYSVEYTFADGTKLFLYGRCIEGCHDEFASYAHGSKGSAVISQGGHTPALCRINKGQDFSNTNDIVWRFPKDEPNPYQLEWDHLIEAIREDKPFNEVKRGAEASLVTSMGRMAAHTGQVITYDQMLNCDHEFAPGLDTMTENSPAPLQAGPDGKYPIPQPGKSKYEYPF